MEQKSRIPTEEWKAQKQAERRALFEKQNTELKKAVSNGQSLMAFLYGRGRLGSHISAGNAALVLTEKPNARAAMTLQQWNKFGRRVEKGAQGVSVLANRNGFWTAEKVYDVSQTFGDKPYRSMDLAKYPLDTKNALNALATLCPVQLAMVEQAEQFVEYDAADNQIRVRMENADSDTFRMLAKEMVKAYLANGEGEPPNHKLCELYGECVSVELCGRFGFPPLPGAEENLEKLKDTFEPGEARAMLEEINSFSKTLGDRVAQEFAPPEKAKPTRPVERG